MSELEDHKRIWFTTPDIETERQFIDEYVLDAVQRMDAHEACEKFIFVRAGHDPSLDEGGVIVDIYGEPETIIEQESERWDELTDAGPLREWDQDDTDIPSALAEHYGEQGVVRHEELRALASRIARETLDAFDSPLAPVDEYPEEAGEPVGWYRFIHFLSNHQGYSGRAENDACLKNIESDLHTRAQTQGVDAAQETIDEYIERLEQVREDVEHHREQDQ